MVDASAPGGSGSSNKGTSLYWGAAAFGLALHTLSGGVALASAVRTDRGLGATAMGVFVATLVHKPADALTLVSLMLRAGVPRKQAHLVNLGFSLMIPLGAALFWVGVGFLGNSSLVTSNTLAFSAGTFLCIALSDLLPELQFHAHDRWKLSAALLAGVALMALAGRLEPADPEILLGRTERRDSWGESGFSSL